MDSLTAILIIEGVEECDDEERLIEAWQHLLNTGEVWTLQGWYGRTATNLIKQEKQDEN